MSSSLQDVSKHVNTCGKTKLIEGHHESTKEYSNVISDNLFKGRQSTSIEKGQELDTILLPLLYASQPLQPLVHGEIRSDNGLSLGLVPSVCNAPNETVDISTATDGELEEGHRKISLDVTSNLIDVATSSSDCRVGFSGLRENKVNGGENSTQELLDNIGVGKSCSCSFCLKAAHMWMDLTFQDTRGRLTELRKSKKRAHDQIARFAQDFSKTSKASNLEYDLMQHWKMLFVHTQNSFAHELSKTQSELKVRSKVMDNCKRELESRSSNAS